MLLEDSDIRTKSVERKKDRLLFGYFAANIRRTLQSVRAENPDSTNIEAIRLFIDKFYIAISKAIPNKEQELTELVEQLSAISPEDEFEFIQGAANRLKKFFVKNYSFEEIEEIMQREWLAKYKSLNRLIAYDIEASTLRLQVPPTFTEDTRELRILFIDAMKKIAEKLKNDPDFIQVQTIVGQSWIIRRAQKTMEKFGFTVTHIDPETGIGRAEISKEKLIDIFG